MGLRKFLVILTITLLLVLTIVVWLYPLNDDFKTKNSLWNGTTEILASYAVSPLESLSELPQSPGGTTLILIPYLDLTSDELAELNSFVTRGGTLVLADDYGHGNDVLEYLGVKARFSQQALLDPLSNYKNKWFPKIIHLKNSPLTINTDSLVFNHATSLVNVENDDIIALSSLFSFLDQNGNETHDNEESTGPLPVISQHQIGEGQIILISDPSIFINSMEPLGGNRNFIKNIAAAATSGFLIDQKHLPPSNLHQTKDILERVRDLLAAPLGILLLVVLILVLILPPVWRKQATTFSRPERR